jgi:predicted nucleic acid-binding protein
MPPMVQKDDVDESSLIISIRLMDDIGFLLQAEAAVSDKKILRLREKVLKQISVVSVSFESLSFFCTMNVM